MRNLLDSRWRGAVLVAACLALVLTAVGHPRAISADLVISQVYGGGGNTNAQYKNDFVEIFNRGSVPVSLNGKSIQYASATGTGNFGGQASQITPLPNVSLPPGQYYLVQENAGTGGYGVALPTADFIDSTPIDLSGSAGKVALVNSATTLGCNGGSAPCSDTQKALIIDLVGYGGANFFEGAAAPGLSNITAAFRTGAGCVDTDNNSADFTAAAPAPRNTSSTLHVCPVNPPTDPTVSGIANPATAEIGGTTTLVATVVPGTNPPSTGLTVTANLSAIGIPLPQTFYDDGTHGDATAGDNVFTYVATVGAGATAGAKSLPITVGDGQGRSGAGSIAFTVEPALQQIHDIQGPGEVSPWNGQVVKVSGIVTAVKINGSKGFFIQAPDGEADADANTSEGVFVYTGSTPPSAASVGNRVNVVGTVQEYNSMTEIGGGPTATLVSTGNPLPTPIALTKADTDPAGPADSLEKYEGMRVSVDSVTVVAPTGGSSTSDGMFYAVITGLARPFREPGLDPSAPALPGMPAGVPHFDGNPERLEVDSDALGGAALDLMSGAVVTGLVGPLDCNYGVYTIDPETTPSVTGTTSAIPVPEVAAGQFTIATFNMLNFTATTTRLSKASLMIRNVMRMPDVIGVEEMKDLPTLQALAAQVNVDAGTPSPGYTAYLVPGNTTNQEVGFLVKSSVAVSSVTQVGKDATFTDPRDGTQKTTNDRPPLVLRATVSDPLGGPAFPLTVIVNHSRSLIDVDTPGGTGDFARAKRRACAEFLANLIQGYQQNGEHVVSVGDYNAFQFNDGYVDVIGTLLGAPTPADQVLLASNDLVDPNLADLIALVRPEQRYSYVENGSAQAIDHVLVSSNMMPRAAGLAYGRADADFPGVFSIDANRPERLSDHDPVVGYFTFPTADLSVAASVAPPDPVLSGSSVTHTVTAANGTAANAVGVVVTDTLPAGLTVTDVKAPADWTCATTPGTTSTTVSCAAPVFAADSTATFTITATLNCLLTDTELASQVAIEASGTYDPDPSNNSKELKTTVSNPAPTIGDRAATPAALWPVNHKLVPVEVAYSVSDNCGPVPVCSLEVTSNEPAEGRGDGTSATDWQVLDAHHLLLRAERSGTGNGRTYTVHISCTDSAGNTGKQSVVVTVPKSQGDK